MSRPIVVVVLIALGAGLAAGGYWFGKRGAEHATPAAPAPLPTEADKSGRRVLYWHDPMYPQHKFDKPGRSPFMNMDLVPVYADAASEEGGVAVSPRVRQSLGIRTALAELAEFKQEVSAVGYVQADERRIARADVRIAGWVEKLHVRAVNDPVRAGQVLAEIYSPDLYAAQEEYLFARRMAKDNAADETLARAARRRLELLGMPGGAIERLEASGTPSRRIPLLAPISGILSELGVREGAMVQPGMAAFTLTDLSSVWVTVEVPEAQAAVLREGQRAEVRVQTLPAKAFEGKVDYIYPELNQQARTVKARVTLANPGQALKPGMFANVLLASATRKATTVPSEAVIQTGTRTVVVVQEGERFRVAAVKLGAEAGGRTEIASGLKEGERVVASGQFLIDSEASLRGALARLEGDAEAKPEAAKPAAAKGTHHGVGRITDMNPVKGRVELEHEPIPAMKWPKMTMEFVVKDPSALARLKRGDPVEFEVRPEADKSGDYVLESIAPRSTK